MNTIQFTIQIQIKNVFGIDKAYPVNTPGQLMARIAGTKTLPRRVLAHTLALGYTIQELDRHGRVSRSYSGTDHAQLPATIE